MDTMNTVQPTVTTPNATKDPSDMTADEVIAKIDELVNVANYLKRVAKPMVRRYSKKRAKTNCGPSTTKRNGFAVPVTMESKLVSFLNASTGTEYTTESVIARTDVTAAMTHYIKSKDLQVPENRKNFTMDSALANVFGLEDGTVSNWFEMQKYLTKVITSVTKKRNAEEDMTATPTPPVTSTENVASDSATTPPVTSTENVASDSATTTTMSQSSSSTSNKEPSSGSKRIKRGV